MKKTFLAAVAISSMAVSANAGDFDLKKWNPYVGADFDFTVVAYDEVAIGGNQTIDYDLVLEDSFVGGNVHVGVRPHKNVGFELGYFKTTEEDKTIASGTVVGNNAVAGSDFTTQAELQGVTLDALGYLPIDDKQKFELIGLLGLSYTDVELTETVPGVGSASVNESEFGARIGAGAQYNLNEKFNLRTLAKYQTSDFAGVDNYATISFGINYNF